MDAFMQQMNSHTFQKQLSATVPIMCDGSDDMQKCKQYITKALMCSNFVGEVKSSMMRDHAQEAKDFVNKCESVQSRVPQLLSVLQWVQDPMALFNTAVTRAEQSTGVNLSDVGRSATTALDQQAAAEDAELGLPPLLGGA